MRLETLKANLESGKYNRPAAPKIVDLAYRVTEKYGKSCNLSIRGGVNEFAAACVKYGPECLAEMEAEKDAYLDACEKIDSIFFSHILRCLEMAGAGVEAVEKYADALQAAHKDNNGGVWNHSMVITTLAEIIPLLESVSPKATALTPEQETKIQNWDNVWTLGIHTTETGIKYCLKRIN